MILDEYLIYLNEFSTITFPKPEWKSIKDHLNSGKVVSTTRNSCGKNLKVFKVGQKYETQWGDVVVIIKTIHFDDPEKIPTWSKMNKGMRDSIIWGIKMCGTKNLYWVHLKKEN